MKYYLIAGEASGDLHGSNLMTALSSADPSAQFRAWGGDRMKYADAHLVGHYKDMSFMGFWEVIKHLRTILGFLSACKKDILTYRPDKLILIDYPGFNLRIAAFARKAGIPVYYYISPQVWAWNVSRVKAIRRDVHKMLVILPFEKAFYAKHGMEVEFVGHPLLDALEHWKTSGGSTSLRSEYGLDDKPIIALLPGSRQQEIAATLPVMAGMAARFPEKQFVIAQAPSTNPGIYRAALGAIELPLVKDTYGLLQEAEAALVTSGTATLETALWKVPQVVCYKGSAFSYHIARRLVKVPYISLVNLVLGEEVVRELIQKAFNQDNLALELASVLPEGSRRKAIMEKYDKLPEMLGGTGASERSARHILEI